MVSHTGVGMLREVADLSGLPGQVTAALADTYQGSWTHAPGDVFADLAAAVADASSQPVATIRVPVSREGYRALRRFAAAGPTRPGRSKAHPAWVRR